MEPDELIGNVLMVLGGLLIVALVIRSHVFPSNEIKLPG